MNRKQTTSVPLLMDAARHGRASDSLGAPAGTSRIASGRRRIALNKEIGLKLTSRRDRGFTLLETFVALVILGFSLAGLSMLMIGNFQTGREGRRFTAAGALAQQKIEDLRATGYAAAASSATTESLTETGAVSGVTIFSRSWTVANGATAGTKDVTVTLGWSDNFGSHQVQLQSKITN